MEYFVGTSGYSYREWKGPFYPEKLPAREMLEYYARRLPAVEINNTFYRLPRESVLDGWASLVPAGFRFSIKASRRITHFKRLVGAEEEIAYLLRTLGTLGPLLGVILFQLPPNLKCDLPRLEAFLDLLPRRAPVTFEFRHESWFDEAVFTILRQRGVALCLADTEAESPPELTATGSFGYLRMRRADYDDARLATWVERLATQPWEHTFVFFKHEDRGTGPRLAERFLDLATGVREG